MEPRYDHTKESKIYDLWEKSGAFSPSPSTNHHSPFTIIMPPPNASDPLHIGHAREVATQDILIRYHRMKGGPTLWLPGADHAGIETQFVFEKKLKEKGKSRFDFDRDTLYKMIWDYAQNNKSCMESQLKILGASCDWTRNKFTLDPDIIKTVYQTFKKMFDDGFIYRGAKMVNYCPRCGTNFSQLEVETVEREDLLYFIDYGTITIATTRPETIFADCAVAVNPKDKRYKNLIGKTANIPLINRAIPIIADKLVDIATGTGALKITPAHDPIDFEIGKVHNLAFISVIDEKGRMINTPKKYLGMKVESARKEVVKDLEASEKIIKTEKIKHIVGTCYRDHGLIEPKPSEQWFLKIKPLTEPALKAIEKGEIKFAAAKYKKIAIYWLKNLYDWNISRQIVWGIQIPAWHCGQCKKWVITGGVQPKKCEGCGNTKLVQDTDTFDTWFSSSQWPFATLKASPFAGDFEYFYPTTVMDPSYDILPFWVIRMIMLGLYVTKKVPFKHVLLHGLVRDRFGVKISKSKGNVIDPIEMINKYGADALRVASIWGILVENDNCLSEENIRGQRNFVNKIWNASRFVMQFTKTADKNALFESKIKTVIQEVTNHLENFRLSQAAEFLYSEFWHWYCDEAIEEAKLGKIGANQMRSALETFLKLLHPFVPFVTEAVWQETKLGGPKELLINSPWPKI
ncbi:valine--tRNA ligase [Candidatus Woesebacteria bacterium CG_4_10_14_0_2_um_filter_39_14]|uniref:Valine--tRNA ligase n=4 Tax=Candidatus Woeseibacteriota TaxID=1752722 RepID=A0A2M7X969_9BACT|nr:MAG: valine--tRNA ligase [Candidatus Woesebacteria bacterium CG_4_10_14_0_2_um_filter_39_14]PJA42703.1 MAG: valine--tRNA ligase [Candidatus Woesebacteria bacterium CG_4_9_14_3_um_filter_39_10]